MKIYSSYYHDIILHENYLEEFWKESSGDMLTSEYKDEMRAYLEAVVKYSPISQKVLINLVHFRFAIAPSLQEWADKNIMIETKNYIHKAGFLAPKEFFAKLSVEQINHGEETPKEKIQYFDNRVEALEWLLEK